jgi:MFS family permease
MAAHRIAPSTYGTVIALNGVVIILVQPMATRALARFRRSRVLATAALFMGVGFGLYAIAGGPLWYAAGVVIWTLGEVATSPTASSIVADLAPPTLRGRYQGVFMMSWGLAMFVGPSAGATLLARRDGATLWSACFLLGVLVAAGNLAVAGARRRRLAELRAA